MANFVLFLLGTILTVYSGTGTFQETVVKKHIKEALGEDVKVEVKIQHDKNKKTSLILILKNWETDFMTVEDIKIYIPDVKGWHQKDVNKKKLPRIRFEVRMDEEATTDALIYSNPGVQIQAANITVKGIEVEGMVDFGIGYPVPFTVFGVPEIEEKTILTLNPKHVSLLKGRMPRVISSSLSGIVTQILDLEDVDIDYYIAEPMEKKVRVNFMPILKKCETGKHFMMISGYYDISVPD